MAEKTKLEMCPECGWWIDRYAKYDTQNNRWVCGENCARPPERRIYYEPETVDKQGKICKHPWILRWGIHKGSVMLRDCGETEYCDCKETLIEKVKQIKEDFKKIGYSIWFASITSPSGEYEIVCSTPYDQ